MFRIIIVDDHPVVLAGLKEIITEGCGDVTIDEASTGYELIRKVLNSSYDLVLLDISLPDINGLDALKEIKKKRPKLPVLVISMYPEEQYAVRAVRAGAHGYITKRSLAGELVLAVRQILSGKKYISTSLVEKMIFDFQTDIEKNPHENLSDRELQVLSMIGNGKSVKEISEELHLSANTIRTFRARILEKIGVKKTNELIHYAIVHNLTEQ